MKRRRTLSDAYRVWVAENLVRGVEPRALVRRLERARVPAPLAREEVGAVASSSALTLARALDRRARQVEMIAALRRELAALRPARRIERREPPSRREFLERYYSTQTPVILAGLCARWRATRRWSPDHFRRRYGDVEVRVCTGRDADPHCDRRFERHVVRMQLREYVDRVLSTRRGNDVYMISNNRNLEAGLRPLLDDLTIPARYLDRKRIDGCASLWFGPAGTVTPLHHDTTNILFCQIVGRKRVRLIAPFETHLLPRARGFYCAADAESATDVAGARVDEVVLRPGDALFLPVGYWHQVRALDLSVSVSLTNFHWKNRFDWYTPGAT